MLPKLTEGLSEKFAAEWTARALTPACAFWALGIICWATSHEWRHAWQEVLGKTLPETIALVAGGLVLVVASASLVKRGSFWTVRLLEAYVPVRLMPLFAIHACLSKRRWRALSDRRDALRDLRERCNAEGVEFARAEGVEFARIDRQLLVEWPADEADHRPTRLGNILSAAEKKPLYRYGLDPIVCWTRLWLLLPDNARAEVQGARATMMDNAELWLWSSMGMVWVVWNGWILAFSACAMWIAYMWLCESAMIYGELVTASFDLYRRLLYQAVRFPVPKDTAEERTSGARLTEYLWRGLDAENESVTFAKDEAKGGSATTS